jgi:Zn-dependent M28 family amino/carboxypeptidase
MRRLLPLLVAVAAGCARPAPPFSEPNARAHVNVLAGTIGSRPVGTPANARAREYLIDQLGLFGFEVRVQEADAQRPELGLTARVANIIAVKPGARPEAVALVAHYDSHPAAPGATDDGLGVAVALEAARVLAARPDPVHSLMVLLTDGEEAGLMGAAALVTDTTVTSRLGAYLNIESIGSSGPSVLFETGPGNGWLIRPWARAAPEPRGDSYAVEIYSRLPNDTDFTILKRTGAPGLNFAPTGDSYAYHTARDTPDRLSSYTIRQTGENVVATVVALDEVDLGQRSTGTPVYFDVARRSGVVYEPLAGRLLAFAAVIAGLAGGVRSIVAALRLARLRGLILTVLWALTGIAIVTASMIGAAWALRAARAVYHPWYAHPVRFHAFLVAAAVAAAWLTSRAAALLPRRLRGFRHPSLVWCVALPVWIGLAVAIELQAPSASHLWTVPLLTAGLALSVAPVASPAGVRLCSALILAVTGTLWLPSLGMLLDFAVPMFGRLPIVTPAYVYPALLLFAAIMIVPPLAAMAIADSTSRLRSSGITGLCLAAFVVSATLAYAAPAYTYDRPLRRSVRFVHDGGTGRAFWEVGGIEPGLDLGPDAPPDFTPARGPLPVSVPMPALGLPFVFRSAADAAQVEFPGDAAARLAVVDGSAELEVNVRPAAPGALVALLLPVSPLRSNFPGRPTASGWRIAYQSPPAEGIAFRAAFGPAHLERVREGTLLVRLHALPGGSGWQQLPAWLPQDRSVWTSSAIYLLPLGTLTPPILLEPVPTPGAPIPPIR